MTSVADARQAQRGWSPQAAVLLVAGWLATVGNLPLWRAVWALPEHNGWRGLVFSAALAVWIGAALVVLLSLLAWPRLFKAVAVVLLMVAARGAVVLARGGRWLEAVMLTLPIVYVTGVHLLLLCEARQSLPVKPVMLALAAIGLSRFTSPRTAGS